MTSTDASPQQELVIRLAQGAKLAGGRALQVGGCVRDEFLGIQPKDIDLEIFGVPPEKMVSLMTGTGAQVLQVGRSFPVWKMWTNRMGAGDALDVALPRRERKTGNHHTDFAVEADPSMSFEEASTRRDFTINAIAKDPLTGKILDPHGGRRDLESRVLRHVSPRFAEDPLRVLRGMQFAGRFELTADPSTIAFCQGLSAEGLVDIRIFEEWKKLLLKSKKPSLGLGFLCDTGWDRHFPELAALKGVQQNPRWHPEGDAFVHTGHCLDAFAARRTGNEEKDTLVGFAVLTHDFGKATHTQFQDGNWTSHGHEEAGAAPTRSFLGRMTSQTSLIHGVVALVERHMTPHNLAKEAAKRTDPAALDASVRRLALSLAKEGVTLEDLARVCECDKAGRPPLPPHSESVAWLRSRAAAAQILHDQPKALLQGRDLIALGLSPGIGFKSILGEAFERQIQGDIVTHEQAVLFAQGMIAGTIPPSASIEDDLAVAAKAATKALSAIPSVHP